jgi:hypothetical protein
MRDIDFTATYEPVTEQLQGLSHLIFRRDSGALRDLIAEERSPGAGAAPFSERRLPAPSGVSE